MLKCPILTISVPYVRGSNYNLMTRWFRDEAGMAGFALSDSAPQPSEQLYGIMVGSCLLDGNTNRGYSAGQTQDTTTVW